MSRRQRNKHKQQRWERRVFDFSKADAVAEWQRAVEHEVWMEFRMRQRIKIIKALGGAGLVTCLLPHPFADRCPVTQAIDKQHFDDVSRLWRESRITKEQALEMCPSFDCELLKRRVEDAQRE